MYFFHQGRFPPIGGGNCYNNHSARIYTPSLTKSSVHAPGLGRSLSDHINSLRPAQCVQKLISEFNFKSLTVILYVQEVLSPPKKLLLGLISMIIFVFVLWSIYPFSVLMLLNNYYERPILIKSLHLWNIRFITFFYGSWNWIHIKDTVIIKHS